MSLSYPPNQASVDDERQEIRAILDSGILKKAPNLQRFLEYVAAEYFAGNADQIKEYNIAVHALHRPEKFDPQSDTIVRVTAHALRKKLNRYYATDGFAHSLQAQLPAGKYVLTFERKQKIDGEESSLPFLHEPNVADSLGARGERKLGRLVLVSAGVFLGSAILLVFIVLHRRSAPATDARAGSQHLVGGQDDAIRMRFGANKFSYTDAAGREWKAEHDCEGGTPFAHADREIQGTDDPVIFREGREGKFRCRIFAPPGKYQLEILFADTSGDKEAVRQVDFNINNRRGDALDIVDEAGGDDSVVGKIYTGIEPMPDGTIHLDFTSDGAFANALEVMPASSVGGAPIRMLAGPSIVRDVAGNLWHPEEFFSGGRRTFHPDNVPKIANARLFEWERYGHFRYSLPVVPDREYTLRLYFSEGWFGSGNGGPGGVGSRQFDVYCNGETLLRKFDILREEKDGVAILTFDRVKSTSHGMLELSFIPVENYPLINAIEVEPRD